MTRLLLAAALAAVLSAMGPAAADEYPSHPITLIVPFPPGGPTDTVGRILAERMKQDLGQPVVVENVSGASGTLGMIRTARAAPDGYTVMIGQWTTHVGAAAIYPLSFDPVNDYAPIALLTSSVLWIVGKTAQEPKTTAELVTWLKAHPDKASAATVGVGSAAHVCLIDFRNRSQTRFQFVPYRGGAPAMQDLVSGQVDLGCLEASQTLPHYRSGKMRVFGVASKKRWFGAPEVPTLEEGGLAGLNIEFWHGMWAPKNTPKAVVAKLNAAVRTAFADPEVQTRFKNLGHLLPPADQQSPEALYAHHKAETEKWWPIIRKEGIKVN